MDRAVGIDFGTSTSLVGEGIFGQRVALVPIGATTTEMPSTVGLVGDRLLVGEDAENLPLSQVARSIKRAITDNADAISPDGDPTHHVDADRAITTVLRGIGDRARSAGLTLTSGVVRLSCPASWTGDQRDRLLRLAQDAGLPVADHTLIDEPVAAGIAWTIARTEDHGEDIVGKVLVFDMGGGTLDVAHLDVNAHPGQDPDITVLSSVGRHEAGDALDDRIASDLIDRYIDLGRLAPGIQAPIIRAAARRAAAEAKVALSDNSATVVRLETAGETMPTLVYQRADLEALFEPQWAHAAERVWDCLRASTMVYEYNEGTVAARQFEPEKLAEDVDHVILVGGMSRIPMVAERLRAMFPRASLHADYGVSPVHAVATGLSETAIYGRISFHRPAYDFTLVDALTGDEITMYRAYSPLYTPDQAMRQTDVYYEFAVPSHERPKSGHGELRITTAQGTPVTIRLDGQDLSGLPARFGHGTPRLRIRPNGELLFEDGMGVRCVTRVAHWPIIRGGDSLRIEMRRKIGTPDPYARELAHTLNNRYG